MKLLFIVPVVLILAYVYLFTHVHMPSNTVIVTKLNEDKLWQLVQSWRITNHLKIYTKDQSSCLLASIRLPEIKKDYSHNNFITHINETSICPSGKCTFSENLAKGYLTEKDTLKAWIKSPEHLDNLKKDYQYSCIKCNNNYCVQEFGNY